jgi:hypothetical protein
MASLLDIAPSSATVTLRGTEVAVPGISAAGLATLMRRFPAISDLLTGKGLTLDADTLFTVGPEGVAAIIAAGTGKPGSVEAEAVASTLTFGDQIEALAKILEVTLPEGTKKLEARLVDMLRRTGLSQTPSQTPSPTSLGTATPAPSDTPPAAQ